MSRKRRIVVCAAGVACAGLLIAGRLSRPGPKPAAAATVDPLIDGAVFPDLAGQSHVDPKTEAAEPESDDMLFANVLSTGGRMRMAIGVEPMITVDPVLSTVRSGVRAPATLRSGSGAKSPAHLIGPLRAGGGGIRSLVATRALGVGSKTADHGDVSGAFVGSDLNPIPSVGIVPPAIVVEPPPQVPAAGDPPPPVTLPVDAPVAAVPLPPALPAGVAGLIAAAAIARRWKRQGC